LGTVGQEHEESLPLSQKRTTKQRIPFDFAQGKLFGKLSIGQDPCPHRVLIAV